MNVGRTAWFLALTALLFRVAVLGGLYFRHGSEIFYTPDTKTYIGPGERLWSHGEFTAELSDGSRYWETMRTPVYPAVIGLFKRVSDRDWELATVALQIVLDSALTLVVFMVGRKIGGEQTGIVAGLLYAFSLTSAIYCTKVLTETVFTTLTFCGLALMLWLQRLTASDGRRALIVGAGGGLVLSLAALTRPLGYYIFLVCVGVALLHASWQGSGPNLWTRLRPWLVCLLVFFAATNLWVLRNGIRTGYWSIASIDYVNLMFYRAAPVEARATGRSLDDVYATYRRQYELAEAPTWDQSPAGLAKGKEMKRAATRTIAAHPLAYLGVAVRGALNTMFGPNRTDLDHLFGTRAGRLVGFGVMAALGMLWALMLIGVVAERRLWLPALLMAVLLAVSSGAEAYARFRVVLEPLLAVGAAAALVAASRQAAKGALARSHKCGN
jgi:hypothetical protein